MPGQNQAQQPQQPPVVAPKPPPRRRTPPAKPLPRLPEFGVVVVSTRLHLGQAKGFAPDKSRPPLEVGDKVQLDSGGGSQKSVAKGPRGVPYVKVLQALRKDGTKEDLGNADLWVKSNRLGGPSFAARVAELKKAAIAARPQAAPEEALAAELDDSSDDSGLAELTNVASAITGAVNYPYQLQQDYVEGAPSAVGGDVASGVGSVVGIAQLCQKFKQWKDLEGWDRADTVVNFLGGVGSLGATATDVPQQAELLGSGQATGQAQSASNIGSGITGSFISLALDVWGAFRGWYDTLASAKKKGAEAVAQGAAQAAGSTLAVAQDAMNAAVQILQFLNEGLGNLLQAVPGVGIAISALKLIVRFWDLVKSAMGRKRLRTEKQAVKVILGGQVGVTLKGKKPNASSLQWEPAKVTVGERLASLDEKAKASLAWLDDYKDKTVQVFAQDLAGLDKPPSTSEVIDILWGRYDEKKFHERNTAKAVTRASIEVSQEVTNIAGEIATLTGVGAVAGAGVKGGVAGWKSLTAGVRWLKQTARDIADKKNREKLKSGQLAQGDVEHFSFKHFFTQGPKKAMRPGLDPKSTQAKNERYATEAYNLLVKMASAKNDLQLQDISRTLQDIRVDLRELGQAQDTKTALNVLVAAFKRR